MTRYTGTERLLGQVKLHWYRGWQDCSNWGTKGAQNGYTGIKDNRIVVLGERG